MKKLGFGLMRLPTTGSEADIDMKELCRMADTFLERGYTYFDTAYMYHGGRSESAAGEAIVSRHPRDSFWLTSKLPTFYLKEKGDQEKIFAEQLRRCKVEYFDNYLLHSLDERNYATAEKFGSFDYVAKLKEQGYIRHYGFSFHDSAEVLDKILTAHPEVEFVQLQLNYLDWEDERIQSRKCYETAVRHGKKVIVMEPVKGGTLANIPPEAQKLMQECHPDWSPASWALRFVAGLENVKMVLSGMSTPAQLEENTSFMGDVQPFDERENALVAAVTGLIKGKGAIACTACRYCTESCPKNIAIPDYFSLYNASLSKKDAEEEKKHYAALGEKFGKADDCIRCKKCERVCPQHLPVTEYLPKIAELFK